MRLSWSGRIGVIAIGFAVVQPAAAQLLPPERTGSNALKALQFALAVECSKVVEADQIAAVAEARRLLETQWLATDRGHFTAYTMPGEQRNPFDLTAPKGPPVGPRNGFVLARSVVCTLETIGAPRPQAPLRIRFVAPLYRFHEVGRWSQPMRDGLVMEVEAMPQPPGSWQVRATRHEKAVLDPEQSPRLPLATELPKSGRWPEPVPGCRRDERWNGDACVARKAKV